MLSVIPRGIFSLLLPFAAILALAVAVLGIVLLMVKNKSFAQRCTIVASLFCVVIAGISWVFNMGWLRFIMTFLLIPFAHAILFLITVFSTVKYVDKSAKIKIINLLFMLTYLMFYVFLPDGGDVGGLYFFFGIIKNNILCDFAYYIASAAFAGNIVLFVLQLVAIRNFKRTNRKNDEFIDVEYVVSDEEN